MDEQLRQVLDSVIMPGAGRSVLQLGLVQNIDRMDGQVQIALGDAALLDDTKRTVEESVRGSRHSYRRGGRCPACEHVH